MGSTEEKETLTNKSVGRPCFERQQEVNREHVLVATHGICKQIRIFPLNMINKEWSTVKTRSRAAGGIWSPVGHSMP